MTAPRKPRTTKPKPTEEAEGKPDADFETQAGIPVEEVMEEAKRSFSLRDRLKGFKGSQKRHLLFFDMEAADRAAALKDDLDGAERTQEAIVERMKAEGKADDEGNGFDDDTKALLAVAERATERKREEFAEAYAEATANAMEFTMRYVSQAEVDGIEKAAKKHFGLKFNDKVDEADLEEYTQIRTFISLARCVVKIVDSEGNEAEEMTVDDARAIHEEAPSVVWRTLLVSVNSLLYSNQFAKLATDNPGF